ncbi:WcbI family polysaccharide biosynthesis putative acetyltransferase [Methylomagnum ishizawai]|nr:WcbI family polysaccharide biosynthesis putative acetyltransferase [Methylomagnum ishizawai]
MLFRSKKQTIYPHHEIGPPAKDAELGKSSEKLISISDSQIANNNAMDGLQHRVELRLPKIKVPQESEVGFPFEVATEGLASGTQIFADKTYIVGQVTNAGVVKVVLNALGKRSVDIKCGETWLSAEINIIRPRHEKKKFAIYGNCQSLALASVLMRFSDFRNKFEIIKLDPVHLISNAAHDAFLNKSLPNLDVLLYQPVKEGYRGNDRFSSKYLLTQLKEGARAISFPSIQSYCYHPTVFLFKSASEDISSICKEIFGLPIHELYHFHQIVKSYLSGASLQAAIVSFDQASDKDIEYYHARIQDSWDRLLQAEIEHAIDIRISDFIKSRYKQSLLFHTPSHPSGEVLADICHQLFSHLGVDASDEEMQEVIALDPLNMISYPLQKFILGDLNINYDNSRNFFIKHKDTHITIDVLINNYYMLYNYIGKERLALISNHSLDGKDHLLADLLLFNNTDSSAMLDDQITTIIQKPRIIAPDKIEAGVPFQVITQNIMVGTAIMADKVHSLAKVDASGITKISLSVSGKRTIDIKINDDWISSNIIVYKNI